MRATSAIVMIAMLATAGCEKKQRFVQKPESMSPTIQPEEVVVADMQAYNRAEPQRWDAVVMKAPPPYEDLWIKRVVGLPGEVIDFADGRVSVDGQPIVPPPHLSKVEYQAPMGVRGTPRPLIYPFKIPAGSYFILGDNPPKSNDSRFWGALPKTNIIGKVRDK